MSTTKPDPTPGNPHRSGLAPKKSSKGAADHHPNPANPQFKKLTRTSEKHPIAITTRIRSRKEIVGHSSDDHHPNPGKPQLTS